DLVDTEIGMGAVRQADRRRTARDFLHGHAMGKVPEAGTAVFFLDRDAVQPERTHLWPEIARESVRFVDLVGARSDLVLGERAGGLAQHVDVFAESEVETLPGVRDHGRTLDATAGYLGVMVYESGLERRVATDDQATAARAGG